MIETRFKKTDLGLIPEDWIVLSLGEIGEPCMCKRIMKNQTKLIGDIPFFKIGTFGGEPDAFISRQLFEDYKRNYHYPTKGDVLISAAGTIGRSVVYDGQDAYYQDSNIVWIDNDEHLVTNEYLSLCYKVIKWATTDGGTITRLYNSNLRDSQIMAPSLIDEQNRIAAAFSDIDALISDLEALIEKKQNIKQGVMQELLSGKRRLDGFTGEWDYKTVKQIVGDIRRGTTLKSDDFVNGTVPVIAGGKQPAGFHNVANQNCDTITISGSGASAGFLMIHHQPIFATDCSVIKANTDFSLDFLFYRLVCIQSEIFKLQTGGAQPHVYPRDIEKIEIQLPSKPEQIAIAKALTDMDEEISILQARLDKYKQLKQGMMQQLLTGRIRLI